MRVRYIRLDPATGEPVDPPDVREFTGSHGPDIARLDRMPDVWRRLDDAAPPRDIAREPRSAAPAWAELGSAPPVPPGDPRSGLVVIRGPESGRRRKGSPPASTAGSALDPS